jgi:uncharacterized tellurite resistance protein B-like protein
VSIEKLSRDVFVLLAEIAVADGTTHAHEVDALLHAARDEGLGEEDLRAIEAAAHHHEGAEAKCDHLTPEDRLFVYAIAYWVSRIDGEMSEAEDAVLTRLGVRLALADEARMAAEGLVDEVAAMTVGKRPERFDLRRLKDAIGERLRRTAV